MATPKILAFAGSTRRDSYNGKLIRIAVEGAKQAGADVTLLNLNDYELPLFNEDLEKENPPENARKLKKIFVEHQGLMISAPEYNSSITPLLKNTIDWVSRPASGEPALVAYTGKVAVLMSASPGALGGLRGLVTVRSILGNIGVIVLPDQVAIPKAADAFDAQNQLKDARQQNQIQALGSKLTSVLAKFTS